MKKFIILFLTIGLFLRIDAQDNTIPSPIIFIYDASGSMWGQMEGKTKMEIAADVLSTSVSNLPDNQKLGFVAYGHRKEGDCKDVEFMVDVENGTKAGVNQSLKGIKPLGKTPLAYSATQVIDKLRSTKMKATIILITDGIESCGGNICDVVAAAKKEGIDFRLHIIGFGLKDSETEQLKCAAGAGDGQYYDAANAGGLGEVLNEATAATVDDPAENFSVFVVKNGKPIDAHVRAFKGGANTSVDVERTYGDTTFLYLPAGTYDLEITPLASDMIPITVTGVTSFDDKIAHQTVSFDGGKINVTTSNNGEGWDASVAIYSSESKKRITGGRTYGRTDEFELNPGTYDVEVVALNMKGLGIKHRIENVVVKANKEVSVAHDYKSGIAMIGATSSSGLVDAVIKILEATTNKNVASGRTYTRETTNPNKIILNPGTYSITLTALGDHKGKKETFTAIVKEGETVEKITTF
ncbi:MAG: vWA domain-containing protein [Cyclobacteriaceae bacterium]